jgi:integrase
MAFFGEKKLADFTTDDVEAFKLSRKKDGVQPRTINSELTVFGAILRYARDIPVRVGKVKIKKLPEIGRGRVAFWDDEQLAHLVASVERVSPDLVPIVLFIANTGCREGEALACEQAWVDLKRGLVTIQPNEHWQPKNGEPREVPISDAIRPWLERAMATPHRYVFRTAKKRNGERTRWAKWPKRAFNRARTLAGRCAACLAADPGGRGGVPRDVGGRAPAGTVRKKPEPPSPALRCNACAPQLKGGPHTLRHSFASHFLAGEPDMFLLAQVMGHSHTAVTALYSHLLPRHLERARNVVNISASVGPAAHEARKRWKAGAR